MAKKTTVYRLTSENLTGLGGPMGSEHTWDNWSKLFHDLGKAKEYAERDYKKQCKGTPEQAIKWTRRNGGYSTQDLRFVMYNVQREVVL